jgi:hypothetical protein
MGQYGNLALIQPIFRAQDPISWKALDNYLPFTALQKKTLLLRDYWNFLVGEGNIFMHKKKKGLQILHS